LNCSDSDAAIRTLLAAHSDARDIEITAAGLEQAFLQLTAADTDVRESGAGTGLGGATHPSVGASPSAGAAAFAASAFGEGTR
jgi:hypothetical protein